MHVKFATTALPKSDFLHFKVNTILTNSTTEIMSLCKDTYKTLADSEEVKLDNLMYNLFQDSAFEEFEAQLAKQKQLLKTLNKKYAKIKGKKLAKLLTNQNTDGNLPKSKRKCRRFRRKTEKGNQSKEKQSKTTNSHNTVINLSKIILTPDQNQLLSRGPKYCPTPKRLDKERLLEDTKEGCRRIRLKELFFDLDIDAQTHTAPKFYKKKLLSTKERQRQST